MCKQTIERIEENKIIVIVRGVAREDLIPLVSAMYEGGIRLVECTYDATGKIPDEDIAANIEMLVKHFKDKMEIGAGTVITEKQVALTAKAGGKFIISPDTAPEVIRATKEAGLVSIPGALTPTEVRAANKAGADFVKLFPVDVFGPKYVKTLLAPLSNVKVLAVNGISDQNMNDYLAAGASGVGVGSGIVRKDLIAKGDFAGITEAAKNYVQKLPR
ncbi:MAG: bifunctional 4-hydroxy-2-oxoglutarate aldolase/2-dehydro-3-deoxy-phosphogluconate aldolase [Clostridia bacterium]|nr:bifunctional 4-hydroxy-2-oxoglutarate aldolase/2-dehydro-3-deoxy-phosphogluconate aldolase [Clostridia bacterium]